MTNLNDTNTTATNRSAANPRPNEYILKAFVMKKDNYFFPVFTTPIHRNVNLVKRPGAENGYIPVATYNGKPTLSTGVHIHYYESGAWKRTISSLTEWEEKVGATFCFTIPTMHGNTVNETVKLILRRVCILMNAWNVHNFNIVAEYTILLRGYSPIMKAIANYFDKDKR